MKGCGIFDPPSLAVSYLYGLGNSRFSKKIGIANQVNFLCHVMGTSYGQEMRNIDGKKTPFLLIKVEICLFSMVKGV